MNYYAHTTENDESTWQPLEEHLRNVAEMAKHFAAEFDSEEWGWLAGLWHDLGKYRSEFQDKLHGANVSAEHSGAGAALAMEIKNNSDTTGIPLAFTIAGHHAGLANPSVQEYGKPLKQRLDENKSILNAIRKNIPVPMLEYDLPKIPTFIKRTLKTELGRTTEFWIRMLFACLIDADRLDTEKFMNEEQSKERGHYEALNTLQERLDKHIDDKMSSLPVSNRENKVNNARKYILDACRKSANKSKGIFSLSVPTGAGKTLSAMSFALNHATKNKMLRVIVVIPYTSIIEQNAAVYRDIIGNNNVIEHHSNIDPIKRQEEYGDLEYRRQLLASENWDAPVIVTTTVQFFESLFSNNPSRCRKLHNITNSVIILDEVQTLPPEYLLSILDGLNQLTTNYGCSIVLSTATMPALAKRERMPAGLTNIQPIVPETESIAKSLIRVKTHWPDLDAPTNNWDSLVDKFGKHSAALIIVHRRADARLVAEKLSSLYPDNLLFHLSALMCPTHRTDTLIQIRKTLKEKKTCRVVSTQLVEAGVDLDFPVLFRALGGLDSMVQAAGRCNREGNVDYGSVEYFVAPSNPPPGTPRQALEITKTLLRKMNGTIDLDNPNIFDEYFRMLYFKKTLDAKGIQTHRKDLKFVTVNDEFKLIEDGFTKTIVVPYGDSENRLHDLYINGASRERYRRLQPFTVNVYSQAFDTLNKAGAIEESIDNLYTLATPFKHLYDKRFGLIFGDDFYADPSALIG